MEAPKKIYVNIGPRQSLVARAGQTLKSDKEYIRKDALLEWVKEMKNINLEEANKKNDTFSYGIAIGIVTGFAAMIDKLNSM